LTFDEDFARAVGIKTDFYNIVFAVLCSIVVVLGMRLMGALLISSLIIFPTMSAMQVAKTFKKVVILSTVISLICFVIGMIVGGPVGMFIGALVSLYTHNQTARNLINSAWNAIKEAVSTAITFIIGRINAAISAVQGLITAFQAAGRLDWNGIKAGGAQFIGGVKGVFLGEAKNNRGLPKTSNVNSILCLSCFL